MKKIQRYHVLLIHLLGLATNKSINIDLDHLFFLLLSFCESFADLTLVLYLS